MKKFASRKFLLALSAFIASAAHGNVAGMVAVAVAYLAAEGAIDAKTASAVTEAVTPAP